MRPGTCGIKRATLRFEVAGKGARWAIRDDDDHRDGGGAVATSTSLPRNEVGPWQ